MSSLLVRDRELGRKGELVPTHSLNTARKKHLCHVWPWNLLEPGSPAPGTSGGDQWEGDGHTGTPDGKES